MGIISSAAEQFIIEQEVSSEAVYKKKYHRPTWPGGRSGVTVGIGYDLGMSTIAQIRSAWGNLVTQPMLQAMTHCAGMTGAAGHTALIEVYDRIDIPWDKALYVFESVDMPRWVSIVSNKLPNCNKLSPDCMGVLVSLAYNRGPSFDADGDRYREMRAIKKHMADEEFDRIPDELRSMVRLWPGSNERGLVNRRRAEADLFERGLQQMNVTPVGNVPLPQPRPDIPNDVEPGAQDTGDDPFVPDVAPIPVAIDAARAPKVTQELPYSNSVMIRVVKTDLASFGYHEFGELNGDWGGRTVAAIAAFKLDRHVNGAAVIDDQLMEEIDKAKAEGWTRPMADFRKDATVADLAKKGNVPVKAAAQNKFVAWGLGIASSIGAFFKGVLDQSSDAVSYLSPVKDFLWGIPSAYWFLTLVALAVGLWLNANKTQMSVKKDFNEGKLL